MCKLVVFSFMVALFLHLVSSDHLYNIPQKCQLKPVSMSTTETSFTLSNCFVSATFDLLCPSIIELKGDASGLGLL